MSNNSKNYMPRPGDKYAPHGYDKGKDEYSGQFQAGDFYYVPNNYQTQQQVPYNYPPPPPQYVQPPVIIGKGEIMSPAKARWMKFVEISKRLGNGIKNIVEKLITKTEDTLDRIEDSKEKKAIQNKKVVQPYSLREESFRNGLVYTEEGIKTAMKVPPSSYMHSRRPQRIISRTATQQSEYNNNKRYGCAIRLAAILAVMGLLGYMGYREAVDTGKIKINQKAPENHNSENTVVPIHGNEYDVR